MSSDLLRVLLTASVVLAIVIPLALLLRAPLRRLFGAQLAYLLWAAVPVALLAALLPAVPAPAPVQQAIAPLQHLADTARAAPAAEAYWPHLLAALWLTICLIQLACLLLAHRRYRRGLGPLRRSGDIFHSSSTTEGPAVVGWWRPMIVVPADFITRYTKPEQQLILAHETAHRQRRDPLANSLCALLQCLFWFHPLIQLAAKRFRLDQELACDDAVMQRHPGMKRSYAEAMLKTQMSTQASLIHCHWQSNHPLKERIMQLQQTPPRQRRTLWGRVAVATIIASCGIGAIAAHAGVEPPAHAEHYMVNLTLNADGATATPRLMAQEGVPFAVASGGWRSELVVNKSGDGSVFVKTVIKHDDRVVGSPGLLVKLDQQAGVKLDDGFALKLTVSKQRD